VDIVSSVATPLARYQRTTYRLRVGAPGDRGESAVLRRLLSVYQEAQARGGGVSVTTVVTSHARSARSALTGIGTRSLSLMCRRPAMTPCAMCNAVSCLGARDSYGLQARCCSANGRPAAPRCQGAARISGLEPTEVGRRVDFHAGVGGIRDEYGRSAQPPVTRNPLTISYLLSARPGGLARRLRRLGVAWNLLRPCTSGRRTPVPAFPADQEASQARSEQRGQVAPSAPEHLGRVP